MQVFDDKVLCFVIKNNSQNTYDYMKKSKE